VRTFNQTLFVSAQSTPPPIATPPNPITVVVTSVTGIGTGVGTAGTLSTISLPNIPIGTPPVSTTGTPLTAVFAVVGGSAIDVSGLVSVIPPGAGSLSNPNPVWNVSPLPPPTLGASSTTSPSFVSQLLVWNGGWLLLNLLTPIALPLTPLAPFVPGRL
jgi:hypothetical protein